MRPSFNTAGPCLPAEHYLLPPERRLGHVLGLIPCALVHVQQLPLTMFGLRREASWQDKITVHDVAHAGRQIRIFGC